MRIQAPKYRTCLLVSVFGFRILLNFCNLLQELYGKFQGILNKLTPQNFQKLAEQAKELAEKMNTQERMSGCIEKIFLKVSSHALFSLVLTVSFLPLTTSCSLIHIHAAIIIDMWPCIPHFAHTMEITQVDAQLQYVPLLMCYLVRSIDTQC